MYTVRISYAVVVSKADAYPKELAECRVVRLARFALHVFLPLSALDQWSGAAYHTKSFVNQKRRVPSMRPRGSSESPILRLLALPLLSLIVPACTPYKRLRPVQIIPVLCVSSEDVPCTAFVRSHEPRCAGANLPRFGVGSRSCAGREKRTAARSDTPINLPRPVNDALSKRGLGARGRQSTGCHTSSGLPGTSSACYRRPAPSRRGHLRVRTPSRTRSR
jgi:hypothetical protein